MTKTNRVELHNCKRNEHKNDASCFELTILLLLNVCFSLCFVVVTPMLSPSELTAIYHVKSSQAIRMSEMCLYVTVDRHTGSYAFIPRAKVANPR